MYIGRHSTFLGLLFWTCRYRKCLHFNRVEKILSKWFMQHVIARNHVCDWPGEGREVCFYQPVLFPKWKTNMYESASDLWSPSQNFIVSLVFSSLSWKWKQRAFSTIILLQMLPCLSTSIAVLSEMLRSNCRIQTVICFAFNSSRLDEASCFVG